jgi:hypothetical protein
MAQRRPPIWYAGSSKRARSSSHPLLTPADGIPILQNLRVDYIKAEGYANLRCGWTLGCPSEIQPNRRIGSERTETYYSDAFQILFPNVTVPDVVGVGCCAQYVPLPSLLPPKSKRPDTNNPFSRSDLQLRNPKSGNALAVTTSGSASGSWRHP